MNHDPSREIGLAEVDRLRRAGLVPAGRYLEAARLVRDAAFWAAWARRALLALGLGHLLAGIVFFFAYNWADLGEVQKFALIETGIVAAAVAALLAGLDRAAGQALLIGASVLVGVLFAVIGQVYQTGADAYELFTAWTLLILPFTLVSRSAPHWLVWLAVAAAALGLYGAQILVPRQILTEAQAATMVGLFLGAALAGRELGLRAGLGWLAPAWTRLAVLAAALAALVTPTLAFATRQHDEVLPLLMFPAAAAGAAYLYRRRLPDFGALAILVGFADLYLIALGTRVVMETVELGDSGLPLLLALLTAWCLAVLGASAKLLAFLRGAAPESDR